MEFVSIIMAFLTHPMFLIAFGSAVGGVLRYYLGRTIDNQSWPGGIPWGTFVINVIGSFVLGFTAVLFLERLSPAQREFYFLVGTGFCGGFTTFSTFEWESFKLVREGNWPLALLNMGASVIVGFIAVTAGAILSHALFGRR